MSAQQPRAYNYVTEQDFSANASSLGGGGAANPNVGYTAPSQYVQEQQHYNSENDTYQPSGNQQHYYLDSQPQAPPLPQSSKPHAQYHPQQSAPVPPPLNFQSHPHDGAPPINTAYKPPPMPPPEQQQYQPAQYGNPSQQWGQVSFDEKFKPPSDKPKWNDVATSVVIF
jgi:hypothetical protein